MRTVVITGSARGLGFEMAKFFLGNNINVIISDLNEENLKQYGIVVDYKELVKRIISKFCLSLGYVT